MKKFIIYIYIVFNLYFKKFNKIIFNIPLFHTIHKQWMCHTVALPFTLKNYLKAKGELWKLKYFTIQKYNLQKFLQKKNKNASRYYNSITNLKFQTQAKISSFKNPHIKIGLLLLPRGQNPLSYYYTL